MTGGYARITGWVEANFAAEIAFLRALVRVPTDTPPGDNAPAARQAAKLLEDMGFTVEQHPVPAAEVRAAGLLSLTNLIVRRSFGPGPVIALNAHGDVVAPGAGWSKPPYGGVIEDGRMFGRGVAVSKSDFATYAFALRAVEAVGTALKGTVELHFTYDEEIGGLLGPGYLLRQQLSKPDLAIAAGFSYAVVTAHNGCLQLKISVRGKAAHAAVPESGSDALAAAVDVLNALYGERRAYAAIRSGFAGIATPTLNVGLIEGGIHTNVVPDKVTLCLDRRIIPEEDAHAVEARLGEVIACAVEGRPGVSVTTQRLLSAAPLRPQPGQARLAETLQKHASTVFAEPIGATASPLYTDARLYGAAGVPVVLYGAGPRTLLEANAKRADENILLADLRRATIVVARVLLDLLDPETGPSP
jgi:succinyl-diaminopimelate desuccinylase